MRGAVAVVTAFTVGVVLGLVSGWVSNVVSGLLFIFGTWSTIWAMRHTR